MEAWQSLDLSSIEDSSLGEGKRLRHGFRRFIPKDPGNYQEIRCDHQHVCFVCNKHVHALVALVSRTMEIPQDLFEVVSVKWKDRKTNVKIGNDLGCVMCESEEEYKRLNAND